jgi:hypothetical protein
MTGYSNKHFAMAASAVVFAVSALGAPTPAAPAAIAPPAEEANKSVFVDRPNFGRDPFFPNSIRRGKPVETPNSEPSANFNNLTLKGISGTPEKRLAIINNKTLEVGEEVELRVAGQSVKVKCVEVREKSAVISINGVTKELFLGSRL